MSARILLILLTISMVFNVAVLIGYVQSKAVMPAEQPSSPAPAPNNLAAQRPMLERLARELRLDESQARAFRELLARQQQQATVFNDSLAMLRQELREELRKPEPELSRVRSLLDQESGMTRQRRLADAEVYGEFVTLLNADQRQRLSERESAKNRQGQEHRQQNPTPPDVLRRFDRNGNGRLDPDEARDARQYLQSRRHELAPKAAQLPPLWPWFDRDGDGELDEIERGTMMRFLREFKPTAAESLRPEHLMPPTQRDGARAEPRRRNGDGAEATQPGTMSDADAPR